MAIEKAPESGCSWIFRMDRAPTQADYQYQTDIQIPAKNIPHCSWWYDDTGLNLYFLRGVSGVTADWAKVTLTGV